jgi:hypothetical protein
MSENLKIKYYLEGLGTGGRIILKCNLEKSGTWVWTGFILLRIGTSGRLS